MALFRQKRKRFLSVHRPIVTVDRTNVSFAIEVYQAVKPFPFLILKNGLPPTPPTERAPGRWRRRRVATAAQKRSGPWITFCLLGGESTPAVRRSKIDQNQGNRSLLTLELSPPNDSGSGTEPTVSTGGQFCRLYNIALGHYG
jgi:hypothetical protein